MKFSRTLPVCNVGGIIGARVRIMIYILSKWRGFDWWGYRKLPDHVRVVEPPKRWANLRRVTIKRTLKFKNIHSGGWEKIFFNCSYKCVYVLIKLGLDTPLEAVIRSLKKVFKYRHYCRNYLDTDADTQHKNFKWFLLFFSLI